MLSNNFLGNDWQPQTERLAQLTTRFSPFKGRVSVRIVNAQNTTEAHIASLNNIIQTSPDGILLISSSDTGLNPTIQRARSAGIVVVTISSPVTAPCAWNLNEDFRCGSM